jgi:hypothetical protein
LWKTLLVARFADFLSTTGDKPTSPTVLKGYHPILRTRITEE